METIQACTILIKQAIASKASCVASPDFRELLKNFSVLLKHNRTYIKVEILPKGAYCLYCDEYIHSECLSQAIGLKCAPTAHFFCSKDCFKKHVLVSTNQSLLDLDQVVCPFCSVPIYQGQINDAFDGRIQELQRDACDRALLALLDEEDKERMRARFTCIICYTDLKVQQGITLECDHRFCMDCIKQHVKILVDSSDVSDEKLKCPNCQQPLTVYQLQDILSPEDFARYQKFKLRGLGMDENIAGSGILYHCQGTDCEYICILDKNETKFQCPQCEHKCCPQCNDTDHEGTCEEFKQWKVENGQVDEKLDELLEKEGLLKCPECGAIVERISGCQYMVCISRKCQRKTFFCYECGIKLKGDHAPHDCKPRFKNRPAPARPLMMQLPRGRARPRARPRARKIAVRRRR